ncbi:dihydrodipicolinate synthase family protein [Blastopirellula sp. J2-11]|uniref:dihydrodipicolinate synthase family protein n=1 Tax=Blastopirellula sp. J2-11 TaxID=2943192 RepID=UPI0021C722B7|nr:dihydrodipicolinate synthase family protein [Blastopirellula sp. J2-11]UUO09150.1 dihydrodipicolinate synthase family protein [Blastopirellula sp. J2-11]
MIQPSYGHLRGLIAATFTPFHADGKIDDASVAPMVDYLIDQQIHGLYVLGSTGEGISLSNPERQTVAEAFVTAASGRIPVIVQVGNESLVAAKELARHAQQIGADAVSAVSPVYFKPDSIETLVDSMAQIAAGAPDLPFYYYHIPTTTGLTFSPLDFLQRAIETIPNLRGIKFTSAAVQEYQSCIEYAGDDYEVLWGLDEMLLSGLAAGGNAAVGSTYNFAPAVYHNILKAFDDRNLEEARMWQSRSQQLVRTFIPFGPRAAQKAIMAMIGQDCGPSRLPIRSLTSEAYAQLRHELEEIGFFQWSGLPTLPPEESIAADSASV